MENKDDMHFGLLFVEMTVVLIVCIVILCRMGKTVGQQKTTPELTPTPTVTVTPTPTYTVTPTPTPSPSPTPSPTPIPTPTPSPKVVGTKGHSWKPYTRYTSYNIPSSAQYKLQKIARTDERTGIRVVTDTEGNERYCVALGTYWAGGHPQHIGRCVDVYMANGSLLRCVLADVKKQEHSKNGENKFGGHNEMLEFIVDDKVLPQAAKVCGNVSKVAPEFEGEVKEIVVFDLWIEGFGNK